MQSSTSGAQVSRHSQTRQILVRYDESYRICLASQVRAVVNIVPEDLNWFIDDGCNETLHYSAWERDDDDPKCYQDYPDRAFVVEAT